MAFFRKATKCDRQGLNQLCQTNYGEILPSFKNINDYYVGIINDKYVAMTYLYTDPDDEEDLNYIIEDFCVHIEYRKQGIGQLLFQKIYNDLKSDARVEFFVGKGSFNFWNKCIKNANFYELCECWDTKDECNEENCTTDIIDNYNCYGDCENCSHFCYFNK